jgi:cob(I)alamin adenosyltransferase|tara:strand:- start:603 stop:1229 length:627 start_codon:yes stop_codon:yes gene_type:complete
MSAKNDLTEEELNIRHAEKMHKKKEARKKILATKTIEKGLIIVHTGKGKGKTTAAFGMIFRALGNNINVAVVQFVKGQWLSGERAALDKFRDQVKIYKMGEGFTWETQNRARDIEAAKNAWEKSKELINDTRNKIILLDELNIVLRYNYLPIDKVIDTLRKKPKDTHIIITGRNAKDEIIEIADLVTSMELIKHPFRSGVKAQIGIEF